MRAFIIRPFGTKNQIDFDEVEAKLIDPALNNLGITGRTTMETREQGNIRLDMFQRLLTADLVIADISIHNANVYYELGIRHGLRAKHTFLIRARGADIKTDEVPFDLRTDRYLAYDSANPAGSLEALVRGLRSTIDSENHDSPVFQMLPDLAEQDKSRFTPIPHDFAEDVERAAHARQLGTLELLAAEASGFEWGTEGLRLVGRAQFNLRAFESARGTWEAVRRVNSLDVEANTLLGTIYQRLGDLTSSDQALKRVLNRAGLDRENRAESRSLLGRNAKSHWTDDWSEAESLKERQRLALDSPYLEESFEAYEGAFKEDLNHFYSGLNALAMLTIQIELAQILPDVWSERFDTDAEGSSELEARKKQAEKLAASVDLSLRATDERLHRTERKDPWAEISEADLCFLTSKRTGRVANAYRTALANAPAFATDAVHRQLKLYRELGLLQENVQAVLSVLEPEGEASVATPSVPKHVLLFTGHMVDTPNREVPRFPNTKENVEAAKRNIAEAVATQQRLEKEIAYGMAGCASGGDILFHQVCEAMGIPTRIFLAVPHNLYVRESVAPAGVTPDGPDWVAEFRRLTESHPVRVLSESMDLPRWLRGISDYTIWQRNNLWTLHNALADAGGQNVTLIALWNGAIADGPGGTRDMVEKARDRGAKVVIIDTNTIFTKQSASNT